MGALLSQPLTEKDSECGKFNLGSRELTYAATGMQGWRMSMEDVRSVIPMLDEETSLFAVYDGHGGKEVALYCSAHIPELLVASSVYKSGNVPLALQKTFLECDRLLTTPQAVEEMEKLLLNDRKDQGESECVDEEIDTCKLMEEAKMPLEDLLGQYIGAKQLLGSKSVDDDSEQEEEEGDTDDVASMLKMLASRVGITIDFEDSEDSSDEEKEGINEKDRGEAESDEEEEEEEEQEEKQEAEESVEEVEAEDSVLLKTKKELNGEKEVDSEDDDRKYDSGREKKRRSGKSKEMNTCRNGYNYTAKAASHSNHVEAPVPCNRSATEVCSGVGDDSACILNGPNSRGDISCSNVHSMQPSDSLSSPSEEEVSDEEVVLNGVQTVERTVYEKNSCLIDLLTSGVSHSHVEELGGVLGASRKRKALSTAEPPTSKKQCRLSADDIANTMGIHSGTTAVACLLRENQLIVANAGDSRCILSCKGECVDLSEDHKPTDAPELCRIEKAGGEVGADDRVNGGLNVSRALGDHFYKKNLCLPLAEQMITAMPDVRVRDISEDDEFVVLACDGIWNVMSSQEAVDFVRVRLSEQLANGTQDLAKICENLCDACLASSSDNDGTGCDNMTCIIVLLQSPSEFLQNEL